MSLRAAHGRTTTDEVILQAVASCINRSARDQKQTTWEGQEQRFEMSRWLGTMGVAACTNSYAQLRTDAGTQSRNDIPIRSPVIVPTGEAGPLRITLIVSSSSGQFGNLFE
jgi:hypothetical protein